MSTPEDAATAALLVPPQQRTVCYPHGNTAFYEISKENHNTAAESADVIMWLDYNPHCAYICGAPTKYNVNVNKDVSGNITYTPNKGGITNIINGRVESLMVCDDHFHKGFRLASDSNTSPADNKNGVDVIVNYDETGSCHFCTEDTSIIVHGSKYHMVPATTKHYQP